MTPRVVALCANEWRNDGRVRREAEALARGGYDVHVVSLTLGDAATDVESGVTYHAIEHLKDPRLDRLLLPPLRYHLAFLARCVTIGRPRDRLASLGRLVDETLRGLAIAAVLASFFALRAGGRCLDRLHAPRLEKLDRFAWRQADRAARRAAPALYLAKFAARALPAVSALEPDVVHAHDLATLSCGVLVQRAARARLVYDAHEVETHTNYWSLDEATTSWIAHYERLAIRGVDACVTVCESIADWLAREYRIPRPTVVTNAPPIERDGPRTRADVRAELGLPSDAPLVVYVGSVTLDRGLELCVDALVELPGVHFATVGPRYAETEQAMRDRAEANDVVDRVHFVDAVPADEVIPFVATADASVLPIQNVCLSYYLCFPSKLLESVLAGVPVAVANLLELRRFVAQNGVGVVMDERSPAAIAVAVRRLLEERDRFRPSSATIARIAETYGQPAQERRLFGLYDRLLTGVSTPAEEG